MQDLIQKLPQAEIPGISRTNSNFSTAGNGISTINLCNLGDSRTAVLVNGGRFVAGTSVVDVNNTRQISPSGSRRSRAAPRPPLYTCGSKS